MMDYNTLIRLFVLNALSIFVTAWTSERPTRNESIIESIDLQLMTLREMRTSIDNMLIHKYGDSTMAYRAISKNVCSKFDQKINQLEKEQKMLLKSKL